VRFDIRKKKSSNKVDEYECDREKIKWKGEKNE